MKRIYIALSLLIITTVLCTSEYLFLSSSTDEYISKVNRIEYLFQNDNIPTAIELSDNICTQWQETVKSMDKLLYHDYVDEISNNMTKLTIYINYEDSTEFYAVCQELKNQLISLKESEVPKLENIF